MKKLISLLTALCLFVSPVFAEDTTEAAAEPRFSEAQQEAIIRDYAHYIADHYFYGVSDANLLYSIICETIENDGKFDLDLSFKAMLEVLDDEYAEFYSPEVYQQQLEYFEASFFGIGVVFMIQNGQTVVDSVYSGGSAEAVGIKAGDIITAVDGIDMTDKNPTEVRNLVVGEEGTTVAITILRDGQTITVYPVRKRVTESHSSMEILENRIAYINVTSFTASLPEDFTGYLKEIDYNGIKNVIIDLRDNGGGDLDAAIEVAKMLTPAGVIGKIKRYRNAAETEDIRSGNYQPPAIKTLVLVNEHTASASEFLAMALQSSGRAERLGVHTYGKGCMQAVMRTPTGSGIKFTIGEYFTPKDERVHTIGLTPDIYVENIYTPVNDEEFAQLDFSSLDSESTRLGVEQRLNALGLISDEDTDGVFDNRTEAAIRAFQLYSELDETGELDFFTAIRINDYEYHRLTDVTDVQMEEALKYFAEKN